MKVENKAFSLMELLVVILIVAVLAAALIPMMRGKIDSSKWTEANATAGLIRETARIYYMETGSTITGSLNDETKLEALGMKLGDLTGAYFSAKDYAIIEVNDNGIATVRVTGSQTNAPAGSKTLTAAGDWE